MLGMQKSDVQEQMAVFLGSMDTGNCCLPLSQEVQWRVRVRIPEDLLASEGGISVASLRSLTESRQDPLPPGVGLVTRILLPACPLGARLLEQQQSPTLSL